MLPVDLAFIDLSSGADCSAACSVSIISPVGDSTRSSGVGDALEKLEEKRPERGEGGGEPEEDSERLLAAVEFTSTILFLLLGAGEWVSTSASADMACFPETLVSDVDDERSFLPFFP